MAAQIPDERCVVFSQLHFFLLTKTQHTISGTSPATYRWWSPICCCRLDIFLQVVVAGLTFLPVVVAGLTFFQQVVVAGGGSLETCKVRKNCLSLKSPGSESSHLVQNAFWLPGGHSLRVAATSSWFLSLAPHSLIQVTLVLLALLSTAVQTLVCN